MPNESYVLITYDNTTNPTVNPVCIFFDYDNVGDISCWFNDVNIPIPTATAGNYDITTQKLTGVIFQDTNDPYLTPIFWKYNSEDIIIYTINNNNVSINGDIITATLTFSPGPCCFSEGTNILGLTTQLKEEYRLVQDLMIGDFVKSYLQGYRKVSRVIKGSFVNNPKDDGAANCMYIMKKTQDNGLIEDLTLTRNHGVLVEKLTEDEEKKVDKKNLPIIDGLLSIITAQSDNFEKVMDSNVYKYYHFSLDGDGDNDRRFGVWANGVLVETPSNNMMDGAMNIKPLDF